MVSSKLSFAVAVIASGAVVTASPDSMPDIAERMVNPSLIKVNTHLPSYQPAFQGIPIPKSRGSSHIGNHPRDFAPEDELNALERRTKIKAGHGFNRLSIRPQGYTGGFNPHPTMAIRDMPEDEVNTLERRNKRAAGHGFGPMSIRPTGFAGVLPRPRQPFMITARDMPEAELDTLERRNKRVAGHGFSPLSIRPTGFAGLLPRPRQPPKITARSLAEEILEELERRGLEFVEDDLD